MQASYELVHIKHPKRRFRRPAKSWKRKLGKKVTQYRIVTIQ